MRSKINIGTLEPTINIFYLLETLLHNKYINYETRIFTDSGWECDPTGIDAIFINNKTNTMVLTRKECGRWDTYINDVDWHRIYPERLEAKLS